MSPNRQSRATAPCRLRYVAVIALCLAGSPLTVLASTPPAWSPTASEKLMKLPGDYLKRAVDNDFAQSGLASALNDSGDRAALKRATLADLQAAIDRSDGALRQELEHQFLEEKRAYIELLGEQQALRRKKAETKIRLYERLLGKLNRKKHAQSPAAAALLAKQTAARERFESTVSAVDVQLMRSATASSSKYAQDYARNMSAIESLVQAVNRHPMNQTPTVNGQAITQADYLRQLIANNEADLALVDQERVILGYMAKLVSLDALALSEGLALDGEIPAAAEAEQPNAISSVVEFFVTQ